MEFTDQRNNEWSIDIEWFEPFSAYMLTVGHTDSSGKVTEGSMALSHQQVKEVAEMLLSTFPADERRGMR